MNEPIDIDEMRKRHANAIRNTATGRALGKALSEIKRLRQIVGACIDMVDPKRRPD